MPVTAQRSAATARPQPLAAPSAPLILPSVFSDPPTAPPNAAPITAVRYGIPGTGINAPSPAPSTAPVAAPAVPPVALDRSAGAASWAIVPPNVINAATPSAFGGTICHSVIAANATAPISAT